MTIYIDIHWKVAPGPLNVLVMITNGILDHQEMAIERRSSGRYIPAANDNVLRLRNHYQRILIAIIWRKAAHCSAPAMLVVSAKWRLRISPVSPPQSLPVAARSRRDARLRSVLPARTYTD